MTSADEWGGGEVSSGVPITSSNASLSSCTGNSYDYATTSGRLHPVVALDKTSRVKSVAIVALFDGPSSTVRGSIGDAVLRSYTSSGVNGGATSGRRLCRSSGPPSRP